MQGVAWRQAGISALGHRQADPDSEWKSSASPIKNAASDRWCTASVFSVLLAFPASQFPKTLTTRGALEQAAAPTMLALASF